MGIRRPGNPRRFLRPRRGDTSGQPLYATASADMGGLVGYATSDDGALYFGDDTYFGAGVYFDGPELGGTFLSETLSPYARLAVEIAFGADPAGDPADWVWTDVTTDVRQDTGIDIRVGKSDEASKPQPATMRLTLDNRLGAYNRGPHSPNHPFVRRGVPVRVSVNLGENLDNAALPGRAPGAFPGRALASPQRTYRPRFLGYADGFSPKWDLTGTDATAELEASGILRRLGQGSAPLSSPARRSISHLPGLLAYWPLEDDKFAVTAASALDRGPGMAVADGLPVFAAAKATNFSDPVMQVHDAVLVGQVPNYVDTGQLQFRFMMSMTDEGVYGSDVADLVTFYTTGSVNKWTISLGQTVLPGTFVLIGRSTGAAPNVVTIPDDVDSGIGQIIDKPTLVSVDLTQVGADFNLKLWYHYPGDAFVLYFEKTVSSQTFGKLTRVVVHGNPVTVGALDHAFLGHVYARSVVSPGSDLRKAFGGNAGETTAERLTRLCGDASIPLTVHGASSLRMGQQTSRKLLDLIQECEETEQGVLVDGIDQGLTFFTYAQRRNRDAAFTIDVARGQVAKELTPVDDDQQTRNKWEVKRDGGGSTTVEDDDGPMGTGVIGIYDSSLSVSTNSEDRLGDYAGWLVHLGTFDGYRYPQVSFDLAKNPELAAAWVDVLPTDHIAVTNARTRRTQLPDDTLDLSLAGYRETLSRYRWNVTANCSPQLPWRIARYGNTSSDTDPLVLRTETDGSTVPAGVTAGAASFTVYTSDGPLWTTTAADFPITFDVGGFPVVIAAITDIDTTTQTFVVGDNSAGYGVVPYGTSPYGGAGRVDQTIQAGASVTLWRPSVPGL